MQTSVTHHSFPVEPQEEAVLYHMTDASASELLEEGVRAGDCSYMQREHDVMESVIADEGLDCPVNRRHVSYWWPAVEPLNTLNPPEEECDYGGLDRSREGVVAAFEAVKKPVYVADMRKMSDLIDATVIKDADCTSPARAYVESIEEAHTWEEVQTSAERFKYPEVMVADHVEPSAIVGVMD